MIQKIGLNINFKNHKINTTKSKSNISNPITTEEKTENKKLSLEFLQNYYVSFSGKRKIRNNAQRANKNELSPVSSSDTVDKMEEIKDNFSYHGEKLFEEAQQLAKQLGHTEVNQIHILKIGLKNIKDYIDKLDSGERSYDDETSFSSFDVIEEELGFDVIKEPEKRAKIKPVIEKEIEKLDEVLKNIPKTITASENKKLKFSKDFLNDIYSLYSQDNSEDMSGDGFVHDATIMRAAMFPNNDKIKEEVTVPFRFAMKDVIQLDTRSLNERTYLSFYDDKASNIWKNLDIGTDMVILYDKETSPSYLVNSFLNVFENNEKGFGKLHKNNTKIVNFNDNGELDDSYLKRKINEFGKDKKTNYVLLMSIMDNELDALAINNSNAKFLQNAPENIRFVMLADKDKYYKETGSNSDDIGKFFAEFGEVSVPLMNAEQTKKMFREQPKLTEKIKKQFSPQAMDACIDAAIQLKGNYPEKAQKVMDLVSAYYVDKAKINATDVLNYIKEAKEIFKPNDISNESSIKIIFDTGIKLKDMVGAPTTKKEAQSIVERIKDKSIGTKGFVIYSQDGSVGAGRKYTAKAIAGESKSPFIEINAVDFGTKDVDLFGTGNLSPEASMKKLFGVVKAQAETNSTKSAVLFIENFDYFSFGEIVSEYHEKAMSQLIREMNKAQEQGLNIVVIGSMINPEYIGEATSKSFKFIDQIQVETPGYNTKARAEIIDYYIKKKKIKLAGNEAQKANIKDHINSLTESSSYIEILTLLDKAKNVARERKHAEIQKGDFTEAYLQLSTGRPSSSQVPAYRKNIVTSHECGHALNWIIMEELALKQNKPDHRGSIMNFITLDPRGHFGGMVSGQSSPNPEYSFEHIFTDIVCDFGGTSCEKYFYNEDGSWGISSDMQNATYAATQATAIMGQGKYFGKKSLNGMMFISEEDKNNMNKDIDVILNNAQIISDAITEIYADFNREFTKKYAPLVGTGDCIIQREEFVNQLNEWRAKQSPEKQKEFEILDNTILAVIDATKRGIKCYKAE